jgi:hypothetical protein
MSVKSLFVLLLCVPAVLGAQQSNPDSIVTACMARDTSTAWMRIGMAWAAEQPGAWKNDSLRRVLLAMGEKDQAIRQGSLTDSARNPDFARRLWVTDSTNLAQLKAMVATFGWPTKSLVGAKAAGAAFLIAQHSENWHGEALRIMKALPPGEVLASEAAMLEDRLLAFSGRAQRYATQTKPPVGAFVEFFPIDSVSRVEARRAEVGLPPMAVYLCMTEAFTGRKAVYPPR